MPRRPLDDRVLEIRRQPGRTWGVADALLAMVAVPLVAAAFAGLVAVGMELPEAVSLVVASAALCGLAVLVGRRPARQSGGWGDALGLDLPEWHDSGRIVGWTLLLVLAQGALASALLAVPALRDVEPESNVGFLEGQSLGVLLVLAVLTVTVAPVVEELLFRGVVLRGLMVRLPFWPAAGLSSAAFAALHVQSRGLGSVFTVVAIGTLGLGLCLLARRTGRLGPSIGVHALYNAGVLLLTVATS